MMWVLVAIMSVSLIVIATKDKFRETSLKVFCIVMTIFLIVGTAEVFYGDIFKIPVASQDKEYGI